MNTKHRNVKTIRSILLSFFIVCLFCITIHAADEDWSCEGCGTLNAAQNNFCGNCGSAKPAGNAPWICDSCGHENDAEANFCVNCGQKNEAGQAASPQNEDMQSTDPGSDDTMKKSYGYGQHLLYWEGSTYTTGDDGVCRIDENNQYERILGIDSVAIGIFATGENVYFMKYDITGGSDFLYVYQTGREDCEVLCSARNGSLLIGADGENVYFLEPPREMDYNDGKNLIRYNLAKDSTETVASGIGTAQFWNGGIVLSGASSDVSPVQLMMLGSDGHSGIVAENCSQNFWIDQDTDSMYYIKYRMTSDISWDGAYLCCLDNTGNREISFIKGDYVTPSLCGIVSGNPVVFLYQNDSPKYLQINPADGSQGEMEVPGNASYMQIFYDEYGNTYYYADYTLYIWRGSEYRKTADIASDGIMLGVSGGWAYYWRYNEENHPNLFQCELF